MSRRLVFLALAAASCGSGTAPAEVTPGSDACAHCRMVIVSLATAAQIVNSGDEPLRFDELGCLRDHLVSNPLPPGAVVYVADHRTREWTDAHQAVFTRTAVHTPMATGLIAHGSLASRDADATAARGLPVEAQFILGSRRSGQ